MAEIVDAIKQLLTGASTGISSLQQAQNVILEALAALDRDRQAGVG